MTDRYYIAIGIAISLVSDEAAVGITTENTKEGIIISFMYKNMHKKLIINRNGKCRVGLRWLCGIENIAQMLNSLFSE